MIGQDHDDELKHDHKEVEKTADNTATSIAANALLLGSLLSDLATAVPRCHPFSDYVYEAFTSFSIVRLMHIQSLCLANLVFQETLDCSCHQ